MQRYDLRHLHENFYDRMGELIESRLKVGEVGIFLFEVGDYSSIQKSADFIRGLNHDLMNSLKFNEVDWTLVVKKVSDEERANRKELAEKAKKLAEEKRIEAERVAKEKAEAKAKAKEEAEKAAAEAKAKEEAEKAAAEAKAKEEAEKAATEAKAKREQEEKVATTELYDSFALTHVEFKYNSMDLTSKSKTLLTKTAEVMKKYSQFQYKVQGHTDDRGAASYNLALSGKRANKVKEYLIGKGVDASLLSAEGFGEAQPIANNGTKAGRLKNRRVVFQIIK